MVKRALSGNVWLSTSEITSLCAVLDVPVEWLIDGGGKGVPPRLIGGEHYQLTLLAMSLNYDFHSRAVRKSLIFATICVVSMALIGGLLLTLDVAGNSLTRVVAFTFTLVAGAFLGYCWSRNTPSAVERSKATLTESLADISTAIEQRKSAPWYREESLKEPS
jgi:hypothetical protein